MTTYGNHPRPWQPELNKPIYASAFFHLNSLDQLISSKRGFWLVLIITMVYRNSLLYETVSTLIRRRVLIWVYTICQQKKQTKNTIWTTEGQNETLQ